MELLVIFIAAVIIFCIIYASKLKDKSNGKGSVEELDDSSDSDKVYVLKYRSFTQGNTDRRNGSRKDQESLEAIIARREGLWVCPFCETVNESRSQRCAACGRRK